MRSAVAALLDATAAVAKVVAAAEAGAKPSRRPWGRNTPVGSLHLSNKPSSGVFCLVQSAVPSVDLWRRRYPSQTRHPSPPAIDWSLETGIS
ncbi:unnamed protein product [Soboliphyme baturini]|uniref:Secreted protein n=1 Tax=Soboliphyme baturini TaxID=241478 RepID=A0A183IRH9_9BILA|nr:unnamed protein product [Soboliphyme baturini]